MDDIFKKRVAAVRRQISGSAIDTLLISSGENRRYLSGFTGEDGAIDESAGVLLITAEHLLLATDSRYELQARREAVGYEVICYKLGLAQEMPRLLRNLKSRRLGFEAARLSCAGFKKISDQLYQAGLEVTLDDVSTIFDNGLDDLRLLKEEPELVVIKQALCLAENAFDDFLKDDLVPGLSEKEGARPGPTPYLSRLLQLLGRTAPCPTLCLVSVA